MGLFPCRRRILSTLDRELLKPSASVALHRYSSALVDILPPEADSSIQLMVRRRAASTRSECDARLTRARAQGVGDRPDVTYADIGGADVQKQEIREAVELPLTHFELYAQIGIDPVSELCARVVVCELLLFTFCCCARQPRGVLLYGPPGTGKTMMAKVQSRNVVIQRNRFKSIRRPSSVVRRAPRLLHTTRRRRSFTLLARNSSRNILAKGEKRPWQPPTMDCFFFLAAQSSISVAPATRKAANGSRRVSS